MARSAPAAVLLAVLMIFGSGIWHRAQAQEFPYMVPEAPEFDDRGNPVQAGDAESAPSARANGHRSRDPQPVANRSVPESPTDYRTVRPYVPRATGPRAAAVAPSERAVEISAPPQAPYSAGVPDAPEPSRHRSRRSARHQPVAEPPVQQPPDQAQAAQPGPPGQLDCTRFPQLISQAPNQGEMQLLAREYLTCLLQTGWNMEMARKQVISTIQMSYKFTR